MVIYTGDKTYSDTMISKVLLDRCIAVILALKTVNNNKGLSLIF